MLLEVLEMIILIASSFWKWNWIEWLNWFNLDVIIQKSIAFSTERQILLLYNIKLFATMPTHDIWDVLVLLIGSVFISVGSLSLLVDCFDPENTYIAAVQFLNELWTYNSNFSTLTSKIRSCSFLLFTVLWLIVVKPLNLKFHLSLDLSFLGFCRDL